MLFAVRHEQTISVVICLGIRSVVHQGSSDSLVVLISAARAGFLTTSSTSVLILTIIHPFVKSSRVDNSTSQDVASCRNEYHPSLTRITSNRRSSLSTAHKIALSSNVLTAFKSAPDLLKISDQLMCSCSVAAINGV